MSLKESSYEKDGDIGILTLRRPEAMNSLSYNLYMEIEDTVRGCDARALIITGEGRAFCAGDDVKQILGGTSGPPPETIERGKKTGGLTPAADALLHTDVPVIAAVNGPAVGWGMELALMADIRVCSERAKFGELFVKRGLCCDVAGLARLVQLVGREAAAELLFTGRVIDAATAKDIRLVSRVVTHDALMPTALALADEIASNPPLAVQRLKAGLRTALDPDFDALGRWVTSTLAELFQTEDHREGVAAFLEKRDANYVGR
jgi:enoyl-CoA hydratase/carnithine racemase